MKASEADLRHVVELFRGSFDSLWADPEFERIDPVDEEQRTRLRTARSGAPAADCDPTRTARRCSSTCGPIRSRRRSSNSSSEDTRGPGRHRNLVVAATGTGKTMLAGFDYARQRPSRPNLLFLAHREELLRQARTTFRHILRDGSFGELLTGDRAGPRARPTSSRPSRASTAATSPTASVPTIWHYVVIDECHHAPADSYQAVLRA